MGCDKQNLSSWFPKNKDLNHAVSSAAETSLNREFSLNHLVKLAQEKVVG